MTDYPFSADIPRTLADHIKQELAAGRKVRVKCPLWLADRPEGWEVQTSAYLDGSVRICLDPTQHGLHAFVPIADCTLVQPPLQVGDRVRVTGRGSGPLTILAMRGGWAWTIAEEHSALPHTYHVTDLERLP